MLQCLVRGVRLLFVTGFARLLLPAREVFENDKYPPRLILAPMLGHFLRSGSCVACMFNVSTAGLILPSPSGRLGQSIMLMSTFYMNQDGSCIGSEQVPSLRNTTSRLSSGGLCQDFAWLSISQMVQFGLRSNFTTVAFGVELYLWSGSLLTSTGGVVSNGAGAGLKLITPDVKIIPTINRS
jgi:hypothetical protein